MDGSIRSCLQWVNQLMRTWIDRSRLDRGLSGYPIRGPFGGFHTRRLRTSGRLDSSTESARSQRAPAPSCLMPARHLLIDRNPPSQYRRAPGRAASLPSTMAAQTAPAAAAAGPMPIVAAAASLGQGRRRQLVPAAVVGLALGMGLLVVLGLWTAEAPCSSSDCASYSGLLRRRGAFSCEKQARWPDRFEPLATCCGWWWGDACRSNLGHVDLDEGAD